MTEAVVSLQGISKHYGSQKVLADIGLEVMKGDVLGIVGPNGSGKTTLLKIICGLVYPAKYPTERVKSSTGSHMSIGAVMDKPGFFPGFCLEKNLVLFTGGERSAQFDAITERLGLKPYLQKKFRQCSSGVQKRCELAAALLQESELFVLDEPLSGLDPAGIYAFRSIVRDLQAARSTIILADHALNELEKFCTKICFLKRGIIREIATMDELQKRFDNLEEAYRFYNLNIS